MLAVTGIRTTIIQQLVTLTGEQAVRIDADMSIPGVKIEIPLADKFVLAAGVMHGKPIGELSADQIQQSIQVNLINTIRICERALSTLPEVKICVIGSESAYLGSHDTCYAMTKAALHRYVELRSVGPHQLLAAISPPIIADSGMTERRNDYPEILSLRRTVRAAEVAERIRRILYQEPAGRNFVERMC